MQLVGDVHVWLGDLTADDYSAATPDGRPATREFAGERLARCVCADREMLEGRKPKSVDEVELDPNVKAAIRELERALGTSLLTKVRWMTKP